MADQQIISVVGSSSSSSLMVSSKTYDVFLSFRGEDTRMNFTSHLNEALKQKKVETYIDYRLEKGDEISPALIKAIEDSHVSIVILSENYASSKWCLEELSKILECKKKQGQIVIPVFHNIDPSHVRKQNGSYEKAFSKHEGEAKCNKWKAALTEVANLAGWDSRNRTESELLKDIVGDVLRKLTPRYPNQLKGLVGIEDNYEKVESLLKIGSSEVITLGIWGMGGIGKTILASTFYAKLSHEFEAGCFLVNVRENTKRHGLEALRQKLFSELLENENHCFDAPFLVPQFVMRRLGCKKVLIVLDDVATSYQLEYLIKDYDLLGQGSRVIITTRNKQIFRQVDEVYEVKELSFHNSLQLFCLTVFEEKQPTHGYEDLSSRAISYCKGIPLALKVLGAGFRRRSKETWESELKKLQNIPNTEIQDVLKLSYDALDDSQQDIFLDIACFFNGKDKEWVTRLLEACGFFAVSDIEVLLDKALITISRFKTIEMHDLIQQMGREIVRHQSIKSPGKRSRLWKPKEVQEVLKDKSGTDLVEGISLDLRELTADLNLISNSFAKMISLRFLIINDWYGTNRFHVYFPNGLESLSSKLRYLRWDAFHLESLPSTFCAEQLVELHMPRSKVKKLWDGVQNLVNLKTIDLGDSRDLIEFLDLSMAENLEKVYLSGCESLHQLHPSILSLPKLRCLDLSGCKEIESLNGHSKSLRLLFLGGCSSLKEFSVTSEEMSYLDLSETAMRALLLSRLFLPKLQHLSLSGCRELESLNVDIKSIVDLSLIGCSSLKELSVTSEELMLLELPDTAICALPSSIGHLLSLFQLDLRGTNIELLPASIKSLARLKRLKLNDCRKLVYLQELPPSLMQLYLNGCHNLRSLPEELPPSLEQLYLSDCRKLRSLPEELPPSVNWVRAFNCISMETDITQDLVLRHILQSCIPYTHQQYLLDNREDFDDGHFIFPRGDHVTDLCRFRTSESSITIPSLPESHLRGYVSVIILSKDTLSGHQFSCTIHRDDILIRWEDLRFLDCKNLISDHVLFWYHDVSKFCGTGEVYDPFSNTTFRYDNYNDNKDTIKVCGVFPVYATESGFKLVSSSSKEIF